MDPIALIRTNCPRCGSFGSIRIVTTPDYEMSVQSPFEVGQCLNCHFIYSSVRPDYKTLFSRFYPDDYLCYGSKQNWFVSMVDKQRMRRQALQRFNLIKKYFPLSKNKVLEVGCATGEFLKVCFQHGNEVHGIEPNNKLSDSLKKSGINVINNTLEEATVKDNSFDLICLFNVFEHLWDPVYSLYKLNSLLKTGGILVLEVPDFDSPWRKIFHHYWFLYHLPRHLSHFTRNQLNELMVEFGFRNEAILKQFRPTVNALSLKYAVQAHFQNKFIKCIFKENNPVILGMAIFFELFSNLFFNSNQMLCIYKKNNNVEIKPSLIEEKEYGIIGAV